MSIDLRLGDCLELMRELPDGSVDAVITDPPYGIEYEHGGKPIGKNTRSTNHIEWPSIEGDTAVNGEWLEQGYRVLQDGSALYLVTRWDVEPLWREELRHYGFIVKQRLTWHKRVHGKGDLKGTFAPSCEDVLFATKGRHILNSRPSMLLDVGCVPTWEYRYHPHQKPVALSDTLIDVSTHENDIVLDPFMGCGTTGVSCTKLNRNFIGIEINPDYFAIAQKRIAEAQLQLHLVLA